MAFAWNRAWWRPRSTRYPETSAAAVVAREGPDGQIRLIGYVVPKLGADLDRRDLTRFLRDRLSEYMVPNPLVSLKRLPLTPNGKLDRRALPDPDITSRFSPRRSSNHKHQLRKN